MIERHHLRNTASATRLLTLTLTLTIAIASLLPAEAIAAPADQDHNSHGSTVPAKLVQLVRDATKQFVDVNAATAAGYQPFLGCVSGPDHGAMGNHYVNSALVGDGELDASRPEVLIYEPSGDGSSSLAARTDTAYQHISNCTSGPGGKTPTVRSWTGITR